MTLIRTIDIACFVTWGFLLVLPIYYLASSWKKKYSNLEGSFNETNLQLYYRLFKPAVVLPTGESYRRLFTYDYYKSYGRRTFAIPLIILGLVLGIGMYGLDRTIIKLFDPQLGFSILPPIAISAFLGAYVWIGFDQVQRFRTQDFTFHDVHRWSFRFIVSIPVGYAFSYAVKEPLGIPIAFFLGAFPLKTLMKYSKRFTNKYLKLGDEGEVKSSELENLQGVEKREAERLQEEGIANILQLAYCDPVDLTMKTTLDFRYIIDLKAQALLWIYLGDKLDNKLRSLGLRSAHEAIILHQMLESNRKDVASKNLNEIARHLGISPTAFNKTLHEICDDPHSIFLYQIWTPKEFDECIGE